MRGERWGRLLCFFKKIRRGSDGFCAEDRSSRDLYISRKILGGGASAEEHRL